ncbi:MAG: Sec-independent protein translocase protein TatB [Halioglobus sp.]
MFDIGFAELLLIGVVGLLVIGPDKLPGTIRTASLWINRIRRGFNDIKAEVQQELHNDAVMQELRETGRQLKDETQQLSHDVKQSVQSVEDTLGEATGAATPGASDPSAEADAGKQRTE